MPRPGRRCPTLRGSPSVNAVNSRGTSLAPALHGIAIMRVRDIMSQQVVTIAPSESCLDAVVRVQRARPRLLPVVRREGPLVGVEADRDLRHPRSARRALEGVGSTRVDVLLD